MEKFLAFATTGRGAGIIATLLFVALFLLSASFQVFVYDMLFTLLKLLLFLAILRWRIGKLNPFRSTERRGH